jgi:hypothetical protein
MSSRSRRRPGRGAGRRGGATTPTTPDDPFGTGLPTSSPFTVEGQIDREVSLLRGARRVGGWRAWVVYFFYGLVAIAALWTLIATALHVF